MSAPPALTDFDKKGAPSSAVTGSPDPVTRLTEGLNVCKGDLRSQARREQESLAEQAEQQHLL